MEEIQLTPEQIELRVNKNGMTMTEALRRAKVAYSTWGRWKSGQTKPSLAKYYRIIRVLDEVEKGEAA